MLYVEVFKLGSSDGKWENQGQSLKQTLNLDLISSFFRVAQRNVMKGPPRVVPRFPEAWLCLQMMHSLSKKDRVLEASVLSSPNHINGNSINGKRYKKC
jgi:hypothetical protein